MIVEGIVHHSRVLSRAFYYNILTVYSQSDTVERRPLDGRIGGTRMALNDINHEGTAFAIGVGVGFLLAVTLGAVFLGFAMFAAETRIEPVHLTDWNDDLVLSEIDHKTGVCVFEAPFLDWRLSPRSDVRPLTITVTPKKILEIEGLYKDPRAYCQPDPQLVR